jgi:hypothetical protein
MTDKIITQELLHKLFDYKDGQLYWKNDNKAKKIKGNVAGYIKKNGYVGIRYMGNLYLAHRLIYLYHHGNLPKFLDHINLDKCDNRIENLRPCTRNENQRNHAIKITNTSGYKNITWHKKNKKWQVSFDVNSKKLYLGCYFDIEVAKFIAETMRHKYYGQFGRSN